MSQERLIVEEILNKFRQAHNHEETLIYGEQRIKQYAEERNRDNESDCCRNVQDADEELRDGVFQGSDNRLPRCLGDNKEEITEKLKLIMKLQIEILDIMENNT